jgi:hypothetical protein
MNKREFIQQAALQFAAALVKVYDEQASGLVEDLENQSGKLALDATHLAIDLAETLEEEFNNFTGKEVFDYEVE